MKEDFLINPPKKAPKRKSHRPLAFQSGRSLFLSKHSKIGRPGLKINPFHFRRNPFGEELMFVGLNPKKGGHSMRKHHKKHSKKYHSNPKRHRRYHHNPMSSVKSMVPMVLSGGAGVIAGRTLPQFIPFLKDMGTMGNLASQVLIALGGGYLLSKTPLKKYHGVEDGWVVGSLAAAVADATSIGTVKSMQGLGMFVDKQPLVPYSRAMGEYVANDDAVSPFADTEY